MQSRLFQIKLLIDAKPGTTPMSDSVHNPDQYVASLRQILSQGRKRLGLLIGAGAPLAIRVDGAGALDPGGHPLIPGIDELTQTVLGCLTGNEAQTAQAIHVELGSSSNIERILSRVRLL